MGLTRRIFLVGTAAVAGGLAVGWHFVRKPHPNPLADELAPGETTLNPYLRIGADNRIAIIVPRAEMGQGVMTSLAMLVAEELELDLDQVSVEHGPAAKAYFNRAGMESAAPFPHYDHSFLAEFSRDAFGTLGKLLGQQITGGSTSVVDGFEPMRLAGATARRLLLAAASEKLGQPEGELRLEAAHVVAGDGRKLTFGELAAAAAAIEPPGDVTPKPESEWRLIGKDQPRVDIPGKVVGQAPFGIDVRLPDMLYGTVRMNPHLGGGMRGFDAAAAKSILGVVDVVDLGGGIGVIAKSTWQAFKAAAAVEVDWEAAAYPADTAALFAVLNQALAQGEGSDMRDDGDAEAALASAANVIEASYSAPFLAHACIEPMNATAQVAGGRAEIWTGTQMPTMIRQRIAEELGIEQDQVTVNTTLLGGGFGRRTEPDFALLAIRLAAKAGGKPVKVTWSREEDTTHDAYRPAAVARFRGAMGADGVPSVIDARIASPSTLASFMSRAMPGISPMGPDKLITEGSHDQPYAVANYRVTGVDAPQGPPIGFWRSVGDSFNGFFHECFLDELARAGGVDPVEMRLKLMQPWPHAAKVVDTVAKMSNWGAKLPKGRGRGIAFTLSFGSYVAEVVEVTAGPDGITIDKVWAAIDVGRALQPENIKAQVESGIIFGLSAAFQEVNFAEGKVVETNFDTYDSLRIDRCPEIEVTVLENAPAMGGVGEPGVPPVLPALANAIFDATGQRMRDLPLSSGLDFV